MISHRIDGHTAVVTIDNPPANTWTPEDLRALESLVGELNADRSVFAAVITVKPVPMAVGTGLPVTKAWAAARPK